jgi:hypothetical protein
LSSTRNTRYGATGFMGPPMPLWQTRPRYSLNGRLTSST